MSVPGPQVAIGREVIERQIAEDVLPIAAPKPSSAERLTTRPSATVVTPRDGAVASSSLDRPVGMSPELYRTIVASPEFKEIGDREQQQKFLDAATSILAHASDEERQQVQADLLKLLSHRSGGSLVLLQKDRQGRTLIDNLHAFSHQDSGSFAVSPSQKGEILISTVRDIICPEERITQGEKATCTITVAQAHMAKHQAAEYARIMHGLAAGQVSLFEADARGQPRLSSAMVFRLDHGALYEDTGTHCRQITSRLFQTAADNLVRGYEGGLYNDQVENLYEALYGRAFRRIDNAAQAIRAVQSSGDSEVNMVSLRWDVKGEHANHALEVLKVEGGRVYLRNPWGGGIAVPRKPAGGS